MILCVDPSESDRATLREHLEASGYETRAATSVQQARQRVSDLSAVDCLVTEYELPDGVGLELVQKLRDTHPDTACIVFTDTPFDAMETAAFGDLVVDYVSKTEPAAWDELADRIDRNLASHSQTAYPLPEDESARLAALERYTTDPEALGHSLDRLTELATELFAVDAAAVGLIDAHEQRFLSCHGISFDPLDRQDTVCTYAILDDAVTVIEDVHADPRFEQNQGLLDADIRFYASAPLRTPDGHLLGTFCVYHSNPRSFSERDRELLGFFGADAMEHLELRRQTRHAGDGDE